MLKRGGKTGRPVATIRGFGKRLAVGLAAGSLLVTGLGTTGTAVASPDADPAVIRDWNATAVATIVVDAGKANAEAFLWFGYVQAPGRRDHPRVRAVQVAQSWPAVGITRSCRSPGRPRCAPALLPRIAGAVG